MSRFIHIAPDGDDLDGDGTARHPFRSVERAAGERKSEDDLIVNGYEYGSWPERTPSPLTKTLVLLSLTVSAWGLIFLTVMNPGAGLLVAAVLVAVFLAVFDRDSVEQAETDEAQR